MGKNGVYDLAIPMAISFDFFIESTFYHVAIADNEHTHESRYRVCRLVVKAGCQIVQVEEVN